MQEDARSIDLDLAGQLFRINRDGSKITSVGPPPPYTGPHEDLNGHHRYDSYTSTHLASSSTRSRSSTYSARPARSLAPNWHSSLVASEEIDPNSHANPVAPNTEPADTANDAKELPSRYPSYREGADSITVAPLGRERRTVSHNDVPDWSRPYDASSPLRRRNGIRLPKIVTDHTDKGEGTGRGSQSANDAPSLLQPRFGSHSAGPAFPGGREQLGDPGSPVYFGPHASGLFPTSPPSRPSASPEPPPKDRGLAAINDAKSPQQPVDPSVEDVDGVPARIDNENEISLHYTRMIRFIDRDHRRALHAKDKELAQLRERLNEVDTVYRQQLKARDFVIDDLKKRLAHSEDTQEDIIEKARNQVEDLWEGRWKDQEHHLMERLRRLEILLSGTERQRDTALEALVLQQDIADDLERERSRNREELAAVSHLKQAR